MTIEKIKILSAVLELPDKLPCQFSPFGLFMLQLKLGLYSAQVLLQHPIERIKILGTATS